MGAFYKRHAMSSSRGISRTDGVFPGEIRFASICPLTDYSLIITTSNSKGKQCYSASISTTINTAGLYTGVRHMAIAPGYTFTPSPFAGEAIYYTLSPTRERAGVRGGHKGIHGDHHKT